MEIIVVKKKYVKMLAWVMLATSKDDSRPILSLVKKTGAKFEATNGFLYHAWTPTLDDTNADLLALEDGTYKFEIDAKMTGYIEAEKVDCDNFPDIEKQVLSNLTGIKNKMIESVQVAFLVNPALLGDALYGMDIPASINATEGTLVIDSAPRRGYGTCRAVIRMMRPDGASYDVALERHEPGKVVTLLKKEG